MNAKRYVSVVAIGVAASSVLVVACAGEVTEPAKARSSRDGGGDATAAGGGEGGTTAAALCVTYPFATIQKVSSDFHAKLSADCRVGTFFSAMNGDQKAHFVQCLAKQIGVTAKCAGVAYDKDAKGETCRDLDKVHQDLGITSGDFNAFMDVFAKTLDDNQIAKADTALFTEPFRGLAVRVAKGVGKDPSRTTCEGPAVDAGGKGDGGGKGDDGGGKGDGGGGNDAGPDTGVDAGAMDADTTDAAPE